jgi:hypothetical protein
MRREASHGGMNGSNNITSDFRDYTCDLPWINAQVNRLLGWELLTRGLCGNLRPMSPEEVQERLGVGVSYYYGMRERVARRLKPHKRKIIYGHLQD